MSGDTSALCAEVYERLREAGNPERRRVAVSYFPTAQEVIGVATPDLRAIVRDVARRLRGAPASEMLALIDDLLGVRTFEGRQVAYELLDRHRPAMESLRTRRVEALGRGIDNWCSVDTFACLVAGPCWREGRVTDAAVRRWARSRDRWWRRAAVVGTVALNARSKGGSGDTPRTIVVCEIVATDRDDMVAKGLSWTLRELLVRDRDVVEKFLERHGDQLAARVRREVRNKLATGLKAGPSRVRRASGQARGATVGARSTGEEDR